MATKKSKNPVVATTAGAVAGAVETVVIWPMEMIKTNMQLGTMRQHYTGMFGGFSYHIRTDGPISLYRGLAPVLIGSIPKAGIRFGAFEYFKHKFMGNEGETPLRNLAAGMCAGALEAVLTTTPIETIKTKLIGANEGVWKGTKRILATEGIRGMYKGVTATVFKQSSNQGLRFMWFTEYKRRISPDVLERHGLINDANKMTNSQHACYSLVGGITAGIFSVLGNNPFDVIKTRMQGLNGSKYKNTFDCVQRMVRKEGFMVLYSGVIPRLGRVIPGQGVIFMTYDAVTRFVSSILEKDAQKKLL